MEYPLVVGSEYLWPGRFHERLHIPTRQYARIERGQVSTIGLEVSAKNTHSTRRTNITQPRGRISSFRCAAFAI
jgi:hypothetical protein